MTIYERDGARSLTDLNAIPDDVWERMRQAREAAGPSADASPPPRTNAHLGPADPPRRRSICAECGGAIEYRSKGLRPWIHVDDKGFPTRSSHAPSPQPETP